MANDDIFTLADDPEAARAAADRLFMEVKRTLTKLLPASAEVLHVGATAVPGCLTKGDLDIVVRVEPADFSDADHLIGNYVARNPGSARTAEFAAFEDESRTPHLGIQLTTKGGALDVFHRFAEALRADARLVRRYNELKLAFRHQPMAIYRAEKDAFVAEVLRGSVDPYAQNPVAD